jgi:hypothetical protein
VAVGTTSDQLSETVAAAHWNGDTWQRTLVPDPPGTLESDLISVDCPSATWCMAVGDADEAGTGSNAGGNAPIAAIWNGARWTETSPLNWGNSFAAFQAVSCPSTRTCFAVGVANPARGKPNVPLAEEWNDGKWTELGTMDSEKWSGSAFNAVDCPSAASCVAVGTYGQRGKNYGLIEPLNGKAFSYSSTSMTSKMVPARLNAVSCPASGDCVAVGDNGSATPLVARSDGDPAGAWTTSSAPAPDDGRGYLGTVTCVSSAECLAGGITADAPATAFADTLNTTGTTNRPDLDLSESWPIVELYSLDCQSATDCEALGSGADPTSASWPVDSDPRSVSAFLAGSGWETVTTPLNQQTPSSAERPGQSLPLPRSPPGGELPGRRL